VIVAGYLVRFALVIDEGVFALRTGQAAAEITVLGGRLARRRRILIGGRRREVRMRRYLSRKWVAANVNHNSNRTAVFISQLLPEPGFCGCCLQPAGGRRLRIQLDSMKMSWVLSCKKISFRFAIKSWTIHAEMSISPILMRRASDSMDWPVHLCAAGEEADGEIEVRQVYELDDLGRGDAVGRFREIEAIIRK
jgi:hypothetical protein